MPLVTVQEAEFLTGLTRQAINYATKNGSLSYTLNNRNIKVIDISELQRAGYDFNKSMAELDEYRKNGKRSNGVKGRKKNDVKSSNSDHTTQLIQQELNSANKLLETLETERVRERNLYEQQMETLTDSLKIAQETAKNATLLLENNTKDKQPNNTDWQNSIKSLETRMISQETATKAAKDKEDELNKNNEALEKQLAEQKKTMEEQGRALKDAKDAELKREEEKAAELKKAEEEAEVERIRIEQEREASQTWVSKMFGKKKTA